MCGGNSEQRASFLLAPFLFLFRRGYVLKYGFYPYSSGVRQTDQDTAVIGGWLVAHSSHGKGSHHATQEPRGDPWSQPGGLLGKNLYCSSFRNWVGKESSCNAGDPSSIPGLGRSPGEGIGYPLQYSGLQNSMAFIVHGVTKSHTTERLHFLQHTHTLSWEMSVNQNC